MGTLDELIVEQEQRERVEASAAEAARQAEREQKLREFEQRFRANLSRRMLDALAEQRLTFGLVGGAPRALLTLDVAPSGGEERLLLLAPESRGQGVYWRVSRPDGYNASLWRGHQEFVRDQGSAAWEELEVRLLDWFRGWRAYLAYEREEHAAQVALEAERAEADRLRAEQRQAEQEAAARRRQALDALRTRVLAEHRVCAAELEQRRQEAVAAAWRWPEGREVRAYKWTWQTGAAVEDGGELHIEYDSGWSLQDRLDDGWIDLQPAAGERARRLRLDPQANHPVVEEVTLSGVNLSWELLENAEVRIPGYSRDGRFDLDGEEVHILVGRDRDDLPLRRDSEGWQRVSIGRQPLPWVRALVEGQDAARGWLHDMVERGDIFEISSEDDGEEDDGEEDEGVDCG